MAVDPGPTTVRSDSSRWQDWVNLVLGIWLFISPWVLVFSTTALPGAPANSGGNVLAIASWNAWIMGVLIALVAIGALTRPRLWNEWVNLVFGVWVFIAPWVLVFVASQNAAWDHWIVGVLVFVVALAGLSFTGLSIARSQSAIEDQGIAIDPARAGDKPRWRSW
jgi:hypothetical protein